MFRLNRSLALSPRSFFRYCLLTSVLIGLVQGASARSLIFEDRNQSAQPSVGNQEQVVPPVEGRSISTSNLNPPPAANAELFFIIEQLKQEVSMLRGIVEEQSHKIRQLERSAKRRYQDLDARVLNLTRSKAAVTPQSAPKAAPVGQAGSPKIVPVQPAAKPDSKPESEPTEEQKQDYATAYALVKEKKFSEAASALHLFLEKYPEGELSGNAYYWLGEVYLVIPKLEQAKQSFLIVVKTFPGHRKHADAMFKLAVTYDRLLDPVNSEKYLELVQQKFPDSTASKLAKNYKVSR